MYVNDPVCHKHKKRVFNAITENGRTVGTVAGYIARARPKFHTYRHTPFNH